MEITRLNIISDFVSPISKMPQIYSSFWKWGALLLALYATFTSLFARIKLYVVRLHSIKHSSSPYLNNAPNFSDNDDDNDDDCYNSFSARDSVDKKINSIFACNRENNDQTPCTTDQDYRVAGLYSEYRGNVDEFKISDLFTFGKRVVKQWDHLGLGLGLGFQENFTSEFSTYDTLCGNENLCSIFDVTRQIPAASALFPATIYLTEISKSGDGVKIGAYDRRIRAQNPVMYAEWGSSFGKVVGVSCGGVEKVYVKHGGAWTVGDMRSFRSPLKVFNTALEY
nr:PREDICTED: uncharacterized protein LOC108198670 [Daucus carota subsp. sativus]